jgi:hypothetical protein
MNEVAKRYANDRGHFLLQARAAPVSTNYATDGLWVDRGDGLKLVMHTGAPAPGLPPGAYFGQNYNHPAAINNEGRIALMSWYNPCYPREARSGCGGIWTDRGGSLELVAARGQHAPLPGPDATFLYIYPGFVSFNDAGTVTFFATARSPAPDFATVTGLWVNDTQTTKLVSPIDVTAPGEVGNATLKSFDTVLLGHSGRVSFLGTLSGAGVDATNDKAIWAHFAGETSLLAREGELALGIPGGLRYSYLGVPAMNAADLTVYGAELVDPSSPEARVTCVLVAHAGASPRPFMCTGDDLELGQNDERRIAQLIWIGRSGGEDGRYSTLNDRNETAFWAKFADGTSGIFVATIPEPVTLLLFSVVAVFWPRQRTP